MNHTQPTRALDFRPGDRVEVNPPRQWGRSTIERPFQGTVINPPPYHKGDIYTYVYVLREDHVGSLYFGGGWLPEQVTLLSRPRVASVVVGDHIVLGEE